jgi:riboflavin synthase
VYLKKPARWNMKKGMSIAVNGVCSTVRGITPSSFEVEYMPETMQKTTVGDLTKGAHCNVERSLIMGERIEGHIVTGHIDGVAVVTHTKQTGDARVVTLRLPTALRRYAALKGSITVDGVSLTVSRITSTGCAFSLVSYTLAHTTLDSLTSGCRVNVEVDILAKYVASTLAVI